MALAEGLDKAASPFPVGVGLDGVVAHQGWREAREHLLGLLAGGGGGVIALVGLAGTGKTLLLREVARTLRAEGRRVVLVDRPDLELPKPAPASDPDAAEDARGDAPAGDRTAVLLVDEAGRMDDDALERLGRSGTTRVLAGLPGLAARLKRRGVACRTVDLPPMDVDEVARFVATRLAAAGRRRDLLSPDAVLELTAQSGGIPRLVNMLAGTAVFLASLEGAREVDGRHVLDAASLRAGEQVEPQTPAGAAPVPASRGDAAQAHGRVQAPPAPAPAERPSRRAAIHPAGERSPAGGEASPRSPAGPTGVDPAAGRDAAGRASAGSPEAAGSSAWPPALRPLVARLSAPRPPARRSRAAWIAGALCLAAAGLWLLPGPARRGPVPVAAPPAPFRVAEAPPPQASAPVQPAASDPAPAPQAPPRARGGDTAALAPPVPPRPRPSPQAIRPEGRPEGGDVAEVGRNDVSPMRQEPPPPAPPPEATDAPAAPPRVVVHAQPGSAMTEAGRMAAALDRAFGAVEVRAVPSSPRAPTVRYFYAEDAPNARRLAGTLAGGGEGWRVQYLGTFRPLPRRGTIEVWLP